MSEDSTKLSVDRKVKNLTVTSELQLRHPLAYRYLSRDLSVPKDLRKMFSHGVFMHRSSWSTGQC